MTTVPFPNIEQAEEQAAAWIAKIDRGLLPNEEVELGTWLETSPVNGEMLVKCASMWDLLDVLRPISKLLPIDSQVFDDASPAQRSAIASGAVNDPFWRKPITIAASAVIASVALLALLMTNVDDQEIIANDASSLDISTQSVAQPYATEVGEISTVSLSDGSTLLLNTDSRVLVDFNDSTRSIDLVQGEVFFDVAKDSNRPFVVNVGEDSVTAVGTAFSVDASGLINGMRKIDEVIVTEGRVKLSSQTANLPIYLELGQKALARGESFEVESGSDADSLLAWREGFIVFQGESLTTVIAEIDRYTPLKFHLLDEELASIQVGGFFKTGDLDQLLLVLENNFGVESEKRGTEVFLSKATP